LSLSEGETVQKGQSIAAVGSSGFKHLTWLAKLLSVTTYIQQVKSGSDTFKLPNVD